MSQHPSRLCTEVPAPAPSLAGLMVAGSTPHFSRLAAVITVCSLCLPLTAGGEDLPSMTPVRQVDEVVVTATKIERPARYITDRRRGIPSHWITPPSTTRVRRYPSTTRVTGSPTTTATRTTSSTTT